MSADVPVPELPSGAGAIADDAPATLTETPSGLRYRVLRGGDGDPPGPTDRVEVHYHGWLDDGAVFDSSYARGQSIAFGLHQVIKGWTEGMQLVAPGGMIQLEIPSDLGYGEQGTGPIPPQATLHFVVELLGVN